MVCLYLVTVEGGDGSGKGEAVRILKEIAIKEFSFAAVHLTHEPRRHSKLGMMAMQAVKNGDHTPMEEAALFAADRIDHSKTWIEPRLGDGGLVISDRNIHSSLVYQGIIGKIGLKQIASMNSAALIPDIVFWIDCDPRQAMDRIKKSTLRSISLDKSEYFETFEIQEKIRAGFQKILSKDDSCPKPFDICIIAGPIQNEGSKKELEKELRKQFRKFIHLRKVPNNVIPDDVDIKILMRLIKGLHLQQKLPGSPVEDESILEGWLSDKSPAEWMNLAEESWSIEKQKGADVASTPFTDSTMAVLGTLSLVGASDVKRIRRKLGPVRFVTERHTQRQVTWLDKINWIRRHMMHVPFSDGACYKMRSSWLGLGRLMMVIWPIRVEIVAWRKSNPNCNWKESLEEIFNSMDDSYSQLKFNQIITRLDALTSGKSGMNTPENKDELITWWKCK